MYCNSRSNSGWGSIICYTTNEYACTNISSSYSSGGSVSINWTMLRCPYETLWYTAHVISIINYTQDGTNEFI